MNKMNKMLVIACVMAQSPLVLGRYNSGIEGIRLDRDYSRPHNAMKTICGQKQSPDQKAKKICKNAVKAARFMAEKFAQAEGEYLGCVDGLRQGIHYGFLESNDPEPYIKGAKRKYRQTTLTSAFERAKRKADKQGTNISEGIVISRFRDALSQNSKAVYEHDYPAHSFDGFENGYQYDKNNKMGSSSTSLYSGPYRSNWINDDDSYFRKFEARSIYRLHENNYRPEKLCLPGQVMFDTKKYNLWDYYNFRNDYDFSNFKWKSPKRAFNRFLRKKNGRLRERFQYNNIKPSMRVEKIKVVDRKAIPAKPVKDSQGKPIIDPITKKVIMTKVVPAVTHIEKRKVEVEGRGLQYYQGIFEDAFLDAYDNHFVERFFGRGFKKNHLIFRNVGETIGETIGHEVAQEKAEAIVYNNKYRRVSLRAFNNRWERNYDEQWDDVWAQFENNAVVELNQISIIGEDPKDGVFKSGEGLQSKIVLTNLGLKPQRMKVKMFGDLANEKSLHTISVKAAKADQRFKTPFMASLSSNLRPQEYARVGVEVEGGVSFRSRLTKRRNVNLMIHEEAEINRARVLINELSGKGSVQVEIVNPTQLKTSSMIQITVDLGQFGVLKSESMHLDSEEKRVITIPVSGIDPLDVYNNNGEIEAFVSLSMNKRALHEKRARQSVSSTKDLLAKYFHALLTSKDGEVSVGDSDRNGRIQELMSLIQVHTANDIKNDLKWSNATNMSYTIIGRLGNLYQSAKASNGLNAKALELYSNLGLNLDLMMEDVSFTQRDNYRDVLRVFSPTVKEGKKNK
jgi:hypothetical protein